MCIYYYHVLLSRTPKIKYPDFLVISQISYIFVSMNYETFIITERSTNALEWHVNKWLKGCNVDIVNISYTSFTTRTDAFGGTSTNFSALICYKLRNL